MSELVEYALPQGWCWASIEDLSAYVQRGKSPKYAERSELPVVNQKCVRWHGVQAQYVKFVDPSQWESWGPERSLRDGDILWNSTGTGTIGRAAIYRPIDGYERVVADSHVTVVRGKVGPPEYLHAWIRSPLVQSRIEAMHTGSTNQVELGRTEVLRTRVPVAPLNEQRRIVAKLEALQARSRRAREALDAVPPLLEKLRQSILAATFRGDLTKDWRAKNKDVEPATELLKRIRAERKKKWEEAELAKMKAKGKPPTDDKWKAKYKEPEPVDATGLPELPKGWCWASVDEVTSAVRPPCYGVVQPGDDSSDGVPLVRVCDLEGDGENIAIAGLRRIPAEVALEYERSQLEGGELLISVVGTIGRTAIAPASLRGANVARAIARLVFDAPLSSTWGMYWFTGSFMWHRLNLESREVARKTLNIGQLLDMPVPLASPGEMAEVCARLRRGLARVVEIGGGTREAGVRASTLERATLAKAFRGELVPQDPNDEPADVMLARHGATKTDARVPERAGKRGAAKRGARA
ncbi:MAG: hypothetical protein IPK71_27965 [Myxococcales bacterium]|nr:hypothetical protein [Myxococcales bacterium]